MIADYYSDVELSEDLRLQTEQQILEQVAELRKNAGAERQRLVTRQRRVLSERAKLLEAHYAGAVPLDLLRSEQQRLTDELDHVEQRLATLEPKFDVVERNLTRALSFVTDLHAAYVEAPKRARRLIDQALFERFLLSDDGEITGKLRPPFDLLLQASGTADNAASFARLKTNREALGGLAV